MDILEVHIFNPNKNMQRVFFFVFFLCKLHELMEQNIIETKCDISSCYFKFKHRFIGFSLTIMD